MYIYLCYCAVNGNKYLVTINLVLYLHSADYRVLSLPGATDSDCTVPHPRRQIHTRAHVHTCTKKLLIVVQMAYNEITMDQVGIVF